VQCFGRLTPAVKLHLLTIVLAIDRRKAARRGHSDTFEVSPAEKVSADNPQPIVIFFDCEGPAFIGAQ
jgi:hypothetical protein